MLSKITGSRTAVHIDMTPMVDVMMLLVIFFMMSTVFIVDNLGFTVNLPEAAAARETADAVAVLLDKDGRIAIDGQPVTKNELAAKIAAIAAGPAAVVSIRADKAASHGQVVEAMDIIRKAGITKMSIAVEDKGR